MTAITPCTIPHDLTDLAAEVGPWQAGRWPQHENPVSKALKVAEEAGEVAGAVIKASEGRKSRLDIAAEIGDVVIALAGLCETLDIPFGVAVGARWYEVCNRPHPGENGRRTDAAITCPCGDRLFSATVRTHEPTKYLLINGKDGTRWRMGLNGHWVRAESDSDRTTDV